MGTLGKRRPLASPAGLVLAGYGIPHTELADQMGCSRRSVSAYLQGTRTPPAELYPALVALVGRKAADCVLAAIPVTEPAAREDF